MDGTLLKGLRVLETLAFSEQPRGITELANDLQLPKSNVHRTLQTLIAARFVHSPMPGRYACTLKLFELSSVVMARVNVRQAAEPFMAALLKDTGETVHLSVLDNGQVIYLNKLDSPHPVRAYSSIGGRAPAYCVASGKALLAHAGESARAMIGKYPLPAYTPNTITDAEDLRREMQQIRAKGVAVNRGEWRESVHGLAAIVFDADGSPSTAIGISGPAERLRPAKLQQYERLVKKAAEGLSRALGYNAFAPPKRGKPRPAIKSTSQTGVTL